MAHFEDLSKYSYWACGSLEVLNVGWLEQSGLATALPTGEHLDLLWEHCKIAVEQTRGFYLCLLCPEPQRGIVYASRNGMSLHLGSAEIRVISADGRVYAAPNLIYHSVHTHHYKLPEEFVAALQTGLVPGSKEYFESLDALGVDWKGLSTQRAASQVVPKGTEIEALQKLETALRIFREDS